MTITPELLDQATVGGAVLTALLSLLWRIYIHSEGVSMNRFMTDLFNGAVIVPLVALVVGLYNPDIWETVSKSNRALVSLACVMALFFAIRSIFSSSGSRD